MEYEDVRDALLSGEAIGSRVRNYRLERCAAILSDETPHPLSAPARLVVHLIPFGIFANPARYEARDLFPKCHDLRPITQPGCALRFDVGGCFSYLACEKRGATDSYVYVMRNGAVEAVDCALLGAKNQSIAVSCEQRVTDGVRQYLEFLVNLEVPPPYALFLTLLNVRGYHMEPNPHHPEGHRIARDHLYLPELVFASMPDSLPTALFSLFNSVWNACGIAQSRKYDE
jgi:hypothetical protein